MLRQSAMKTFAAFLMISPLARAAAQDEPHRPSIAVLPFRVTDLRQHAGGAITLKESQVSLLTDRFLTALVQCRKFDVVERDKMENILKEMDLTKTGMVDSKRGIQIGKMVGAEYLLTGTITSLEGRVSYDAVPYTKRHARTISGRIAVEMRLIRTETGVIAAAQSETYELESKDPLYDGPARKGEPVPAELLEELQKGIVGKLIHAVVDACYPIKIVLSQDDVIYLNRGEGGGLAVGDLLVAYLPGQALVDPDTNELLGSSETPLARLQVVEVGAKSTKAKVAQWLSEKKELLKGTICRRDASGAIGAKNPN